MNLLALSLPCKANSSRSVVSEQHQNFVQHLITPTMSPIHTADTTIYSSDVRSEWDPAALEPLDSASQSGSGQSAHYDPTSGAYHPSSVFPVTIAGDLSTPPYASSHRDPVDFSVTTEGFNDGQINRAGSSNQQWNAALVYPDNRWNVSLPVTAAGADQEYGEDVTGAQNSGASIQSIMYSTGMMSHHGVSGRPSVDLTGQFPLAPEGSQLIPASFAVEQAATPASAVTDHQQTRPDPLLLPGRHYLEPGHPMFESIQGYIQNDECRREGSRERGNGDQYSQLSIVMMPEGPLAGLLVTVKEPVATDIPELAPSPEVGKKMRSTTASKSEPKVKNGFVNFDQPWYAELERNALEKTTKK
jgi:hypothetical protein